MSDLVYAIDYGTSNSLLAAADAQRVHGPITLDPTAADQTVLKSVLYSPQHGTWYFGYEAIQQYMEHLAEGRLLRSMKRYLPEASFEGTRIHDRYLNLTEIIATFLRELRRRANEHFQQDVTRAVLGRPAVFSFDPGEDALAEKRLLTAARLAGFTDVIFCPEPVAAAFEFRHQLTSPKTVLIADFGGGTSDFTVLRMGRDGFTEKDVLATHGTPIAGDRFDGALMRDMIAPHFGTEVVYRLPMGSGDLRLPRHLVNRLCTPSDISFLSQKDLLQLLRDAQRWSLSPDDSLKMERLFTLVEEHLGYKLFRSIEQAKIDLSDATETTFRFAHPGLQVEEPIDGRDFSRASEELVEQITAALDETLRRSGVGAQEVDIVCCTGGTAKLPQLSRELAKRFGQDKLQQHRHFHSVIGGLAEKAQQWLETGG